MGPTGWDLEKWRTLLDWCTRGVGGDGPDLAVDAGGGAVKRGAAQVGLGFTAADARRLAKRYRAGATIDALAAEFGCGRTTINRRLRDIGVPKRRPRPEEADIDRMVDLYGEGASLAAVGAALGFDATSVLKYLRLREVTIRDTQGRSRVTGAVAKPLRTIEAF